MTRAGSLATVAGGVVVLVSTTLLAAGQPERFSGANDFQSFCVSCHGTTGTGDGPFAGSLKKRPADLSALTKKNGGVYPADAVFKSIDKGHESASMPAWTEVFAKSQNSIGAEAAAERVRALVKYVETLQQTP